MQHLQTSGIHAGMRNFLRFGLLLLAATLLPAVAGQAPDDKRQQELQQMLYQNCSACHGPTFEGGAGPALTTTALAAKDEQLLVDTILKGRPGTAMPAWEWMFKEEEARWLVKFLRNGDS